MWKEVNVLKKVLKKKNKQKNNIVRYFSEELSLTLKPQYVSRGPVNGYPTECVADCAKACVL